MADYLQRHSGVIVPASFAEDGPAPATPERGEIATTGGTQDITRGFVDPMILMQPQDTVLRLRGNGNYELYREVLRDDQVQATFAQRRLAVIARDWEVIAGGDQPADEQAAEFLRQQLREIRFDAITDKMLYGVFYGYAVAEAIWNRADNRVVCEALRVRDRRRFGWDGERRLRLRTMTNPDPGTILPDGKFWTFSTGADHDDEPYGLGLAHWLYWPVFFKRGGMRLWLTFLDKFGSPTAKGTYPANATANEKQRLLGALEAVRSESGVIVPEGMAIELLEAARSGTADYGQLYDRMDRAIAKVVLGQVATSEGTPGKLGNDDAQQDVRADLVKADADLICASFNRSIVRWLTEWNFPGARTPEVWRKLEEAEDLTQAASRDAKLYTLGYRPTPERVEQVYGSGYERVERTPPRGLAGPAFAESAQAETTHQQRERLAEAAQAAETQMVGRIRGVVDAAESLEDLRERLDAAFAESSAEALGEVMREALAAAEMAGRYDLLQEL